MDDPALWMAIGAAILSCLFASNNYALHDFSRSRLEDWLGSRGQSERFTWLVRHRNDLIVLTAIGRVASNLLILLCMVILLDTVIAQPWLHGLAALGITALVVLFAGVIIPFSWGHHASERIVSRFFVPLQVLRFVAGPILALLHLIDPIMKRLIGVELEHANGQVEQDILDAVTEGEISGLVDEAQKEMIEAVVDFPNTTVDEIMTPRTDIRGLQADTQLEELKQIIEDAGHSRFPVYSENLDHIIGILYVKDLLKFVGNTHVTELNLAENVREALFVPESKLLRDLLTEFRLRKVHMAVVLDEYGGTAGLITIEDILEEIVGEIQDEYEPETKTEPTVTRIDDSTFDADGRIYIDDLNDELNINLPDEEDYDTLGGFVFATLGHIPEADESFHYENVHFTVTQVERTRVNKVRLQVDYAGIGDSSDGATSTTNGGNGKAG